MARRLASKTIPKGGRMISRKQQILLKRAQAEAGLSDEDYRNAIAAVTGMPDCRSSKDARLSDAHLDHLLSFFEAIYWKSNSEGGQIFKQRQFWATRNRRGNTSRDRYTEADLTARIAQAEYQIMQLGFGQPYLDGIYGRIEPYTHRAYLAALERTIAAKKRKLAVADAECPF